MFAAVSVVWKGRMSSTPFYFSNHCSSDTPDLPQEPRAPGSLRKGCPTVLAPRCRPWLRSSTNVATICHNHQCLSSVHLILCTAQNMSLLISLSIISHPVPSVLLCFSAKHYGQTYALDDQVHCFLILQNVPEPSINSQLWSHTTAGYHKVRNHSQLPSSQSPRTHRRRWSQTSPHQCETRWQAWGHQTDG